jgi:hypothetical protein
MAADVGYTNSCSVPSRGKSEAVPVEGMKTYRGSIIVAAPILNLGAGWRRFVSVTPQPLYPEKNPAVLQSQFGRFGEEINILKLPDFKVQSSHCTD